MDLIRDLNIEKYKIIDFNFRFHKDKLNLINNILKIYFNLTAIVVDRVDENLFNSMEKLYDGYDDKEDFKKQLLKFLQKS